jgi:hypothetical protein
VENCGLCHSKPGSLLEEFSYKIFPEVAGDSSAFLKLIRLFDFAVSVLMGHPEIIRWLLTC